MSIDNNFDSKSEPTYWAWIYIAGDLATIKSVCRKFTLTGLCVTIEPIDFIYTGGSEEGARVGLINYPRFHNDEDSIFEKAEELGKLLAIENCQLSFSIVDSNKTVYFSRGGK